MAGLPLPVGRLQPVYPNYPVARQPTEPAVRPGGVPVFTYHAPPSQPVRAMETTKFGPSSSMGTGMTQGSMGFGQGRKKRKTRKSTSSSRVRRRSKTRKSRRASSGGR